MNFVGTAPHGEPHSDRDAAYPRSATEGALATRLGLPGIPAAAEAILVARDIRLARLTGGAVHFAHVSTGEALALIRRAKEDRVAVTCDTAPPYFDLNEIAIALQAALGGLGVAYLPEDQCRRMLKPDA